MGSFKDFCEPYLRRGRMKPNFGEHMHFADGLRGFPPSFKTNFNMLKVFFVGKKVPINFSLLSYFLMDIFWLNMIVIRKSVTVENFRMGQSFPGLPMEIRWSTFLTDPTEMSPITSLDFIQVFLGSIFDKVRANRTKQFAKKPTTI